MTDVTGKKFVLVDGQIEEHDEVTTIEEFQTLGVSDEQPLKEYQLDRLQEYPSMAEQLDMLYHLGYDGWKAAITDIKNKYPKVED